MKSFIKNIKEHKKAYSIPVNIQRAESMEFVKIKAILSKTFLNYINERITSEELQKLEMKTEINPVVAENFLMLMENTIKNDKKIIRGKEYELK
ncbi:hypothetical protein [Fusobacterium sp.]|uniref:hypothetical protein n=1 Tax=Fusobacterium sp. TaxID=68766 RepID=UPI0029024B49|nr:hypothetical protein [Fusobacterium sp.]MDU1911855.1 hypothetical protein [Fusobacterium sp.]